MQKDKIQKSLLLFKSCFTLSAFTFGGGYVIVSLMKGKFVDELKLLEEDEMLNFTAIAQAAPGVVAVNTSILLGYKMLGVFGAIIAIVGTVLPPLLIITIIAQFYDAFRSNVIIANFLLAMQASVVAVIFDVGFEMARKIIINKEYFNIIIMIFAAILILVFDINVILIILMCTIIGIIRTVIEK